MSHPDHHLAPDVNIEIYLVRHNNTWVGAAKESEKRLAPTFNAGRVADAERLALCWNACLGIPTISLHAVINPKELLGTPAHSLAGYLGGFVGIHARYPNFREVWTAAIRSYRDLNPEIPYIGFDGRWRFTSGQEITLPKWNVDIQHEIRTLRELLPDSQKVKAAMDRVGEYVTSVGLELEKSKNPSFKSRFTSSDSFTRTRLRELVQEAGLPDTHVPGKETSVHWRELERFACLLHRELTGSDLIIRSEQETS